MTNTNTLTVEKAVSIIENGNHFGTDFENAVKFLRENDADNNALGFMKFNDVKLEQLRALSDYFNAVKDERTSFEPDEFAAAMEEYSRITHRGMEFNDLWDHPEKWNLSDEQVCANFVAAENLKEEVIAEAEKSSEEKGWKKNIRYYDDEGNEITDEKEIAKLDRTAKESAYTDVMIEAALSDEFSNADKAEKKKILTSSFLELRARNLAAMAVASAVKLSDKAEKVIEKADKVAEKVINDVLSCRKAIKITKDAVLNDAVRSVAKCQVRLNKAVKEKYSKTAAFLNRLHERRSKILEKGYGVAAEMKLKLVDTWHYSHERMITNAAASTASLLVGGAAIASGAAVVAMAGAGAYAAYSAVSAPVFTVYEKMKRIRDANKKAGKDVSEWKGIKGMRNAFNAIKNDKEEYKSFKRTAKYMAAAGVAGIGMAAAAAVVVTSGAGVALAAGITGAAAYGAVRLGTRLARVSASTANSVAQIKDMNKKLGNEKNPEKRKKIKKAMAIAACMTVVGLVLTACSTSDAGEQPQTELTGDQNKQLAESFTGNETETTPVEEVVNSAPTKIEVPTEYSSEMGISEGHWNEMQSKFAGIFEKRFNLLGLNETEGAELHGATWNNVYTNIVKAQEHGDLPQDMTPEEVMYKYMKLVETTERVVPGTGDASDLLVSRLDKDGLPMYWGNQDEMRILNGIILCGQDPDGDMADQLGAVLNKVNEHGTYIGEGNNIGVTNNEFVGFGRGRDCPEDGEFNAWRRGEQPAPVEEVVVEEQPEQQEVPPAVNQEAEGHYEKTYVGKDTSGEGHTVKVTTENAKGAKNLNPKVEDTNLVGKGQLGDNQPFTTTRDGR